MIMIIKKCIAIIKKIDNNNNNVEKYVNHNKKIAKYNGENNIIMQKIMYRITIILL